MLIIPLPGVFPGSPKTPCSSIIHCTQHIYTEISSIPFFYLQVIPVFWDSALILPHLGRLPSPPQSYSNVSLQKVT